MTASNWFLFQTTDKKKDVRVSCLDDAREWTRLDGDCEYSVPTRLLLRAYEYNRQLPILHIAQVLYRVGRGPNNSNHRPTLRSKNSSSSSPPVICATLLFPLDQRRRPTNSVIPLTCALCAAALFHVDTLPVTAFFVFFLDCLVLAHSFAQFLLPDSPFCLPPKPDPTSPRPVHPNVRPSKKSKPRRRTSHATATHVVPCSNPPRVSHPRQRNND